MTLIESAVVVVAVFEVARSLAAILASVSTMRQLAYFKKEWEKLRGGLDLGAQIGAGVGALLGLAVDTFTKKPPAATGKGSADVKVTGTAVQRKPVMPGSFFTDFQNLIRGKHAQPDSRVDQVGKDHAGGEARP